MEEKSYKLNDYAFGKHYSIKPFAEYMNDVTADGHLLSIAQHIYIEAIDHIENVIVEDIIRVAKDTCVTDVILLDKPKIVDALKKATPMKVIRSDGRASCPICGCHVTHYTNQYCGHCGQKLILGVVIK